MAWCVHPWDGVELLELWVQRLHQLPDVRIDLRQLATEQIDEVQGP